MLTEYPIDFFNYVVWMWGIYYIYPIELVLRPEFNVWLVNARICSNTEKLDIGEQQVVNSCKVYDWIPYDLAVL